MKLKKTVAFIIALSMIVGLFFTLPSLALEPVTGYAEEVVADESFDENSYDSTVLSVENGNISDGSLNFELMGKSSLNLMKSIDTSVKQYIIDFEMSVTEEYTDPWTAAFIGVKTVRTASTPWGTNNGTWLGVTKDKLILWHSYEDSKWGMASAQEGTHYLILDNSYDVSDAAYRIIYEGSAAELYIDDDRDGAYELLATVTKASNKGVITVGENSLESARTFAETQSSTYFALSMIKAAASVEDDPLAPVVPSEPSDEEEESTPSETTLVKIGSFKVVYYKELLMTADEIADLEAELDKINEVIANYGTEDRIYYDSSVDLSLLNQLKEKITELLEKEGALSSEYKALSKEITTAFLVCIDQAAVDEYLASFDGYISTLDSIEGDPKYLQSDIDDARAMINEAKAVIYADVLSPSIMDAAYNKVSRKFSSMNVFTQDGIPTYSQSFGNTTYSYSSFSSEWYDEQGVNPSGVPCAGEDGAVIKMDWKGDRRYMMQLRKSYENYSVQATVTKLTSGKFAMSLRQAIATNSYEEDEGFASSYNYTGERYGGLIGGDNVIFIANNTGDMSNVYIGVRNMSRVSGGNSVNYLNRTAAKIDLTAISGALSNSNKTATFLIKDMGDVLEFYVVTPEGNVPVVNIYFTKLEGTAYTAGMVVNKITGEEQNFANVSIRKPSASVITFAARSGNIGIKNFKINTNVLPTEERLTSDGSCEPNKIELVTEDSSFDFAVEENKKFQLNADFDLLKVFGKDEYTPGQVDVRNMDEASVTTVVGKTVIDVDSSTGTIAGVRRGTELLKATYAASGTVYRDSKLVNVDTGSYTAPSESNVLSLRVVNAAIANADVFRSLDIGVSAIPVVRYTLPNGDTQYLSDEYYVSYKSSDENIIAYDAITGKYVAKGTGLADIWVEVPYNAGTTSDSVASAKVTVEVTEAGNMTPGISFIGSAKDLLEKASNDSVTAGEYKDYLDDAVDAGLDISYGKTEDDKLINSMLIRNEIAELEADASEEEIKQAINVALAVRAVYDVMASDSSNADDLKEILFKGNGSSDNINALGIDISDFNDLSSTKASRAILRVYTQLQKQEPEELSVSKIKKIMDTIVESVAEGGGASSGLVSNDTRKGLGSTVLPAPATIASTTTTKVPLLSGDEAVKHAEKFTDIQSAAWAKEAIGALAYEGVVSGYEDGTIRPNNEITRDEFVKLLVCALSLDVDANAVNTYSDIQSGAWQIPYVMAATNAGVVSGTGTLTFGSGQTISRQDMATMIYRAVLKLNVTLPGENAVAFKDSEMIAGYALEAVNKLSGAGIISGMGNDSFAPGARATRAQAIAMLYGVRGLIK